MTHYDYQEKFKELYYKAIEQFRKGTENKERFFDPEERQLIHDNGWRVQDFYDYAEDFVHGGEPSYEIAQSIEQVRREFFLHEQNGAASKHRISANELPAKKEDTDGIVWLPRIVPKAIGKLKGELPEEIMYCCGGDRFFLKSHDIHPAEFLRVVWRHIDNPEAITAFVKHRSQQFATV